MWTGGRRYYTSGGVGDSLRPLLSPRIPGLLGARTWPDAGEGVDHVLSALMLDATRGGGVDGSRKHSTAGRAAHLAGFAMIAALAGLGVRPGPGNAEETVLVYQWSSRSLQLRDGSPVVVDTTRTDVTLCLGDTYFKFFDRDHIWVYDFKRERVQRVDPRARTYGDWSLYGFVAFNHLELARRSGDSGSNRKAPPGVSIRELEALFGMTSRRVKPHANEALIDSSNRREAWVAINGQLSTSALPSPHVLSPPRARMFELFLLYRGHLHPSARAAVVALGHVPKVLYSRWQDEGETRVLLELKQVTSAPENTDPTAGCRHEDLTDPAFATLQERLRTSRDRCSDSAQAAGIAAARDIETRSLESGHYLEAHLARVERSSWDCDSTAPKAWPADVQQRARTDTLLQAFLGAANRSSATPVRRMELLRASANDSLEMGYMIEFEGARLYTSMGDFQHGISLTQSALRYSACALDGWMDLYRAYLGTHQTVLAWLCLDLVREVGGPDCAVLGDGRRFEKELLARHPEFF